MNSFNKQSSNRIDNADKKRVELHLHTKMSKMDALISPEEAIKTAKKWGHSAIAITDHGNVQAFPAAMLAAEKYGIKVIYGMEAYFVNDKASAIYGDYNGEFTDESIVFDIETTGLQKQTCKITEIGAVKIKDGKVIERYNTFVNPQCPIPEEIVKLTSITEEMVKNERTIDIVLPEFLDFIGDRLLIAHNADFDTGFIRFVAEDLGLDFHNPYLDTVALSRFLNPDLKSHKLDALAKQYNLGDFNHHRACDAAEMLAMIFFEMSRQLEEMDIRNFAQMKNDMSTDPLKLRPYHQIILVKNQEGLKNLYRLISESYLTYYHRNPRIPKTLLEKHREGLIIGSACESGELFRAILDNKPEKEIEDIVNFYDYLEIQPICNNKFLIAEGLVADEEGLKNLNRKIVALGEKYNKPVVATCDAHFLNEEDEIYRKILLAGLKFKDADRDIHLYFRTTEEMLGEFSYLGQQKSYEVVVENTNLINNMIDYIKPFPQESYLRNLKNEATEALAKERIIQNKKFSVGNIVTIGNTTARKFVHKFFESRGFSITNEESQTLIEKCVGVKQNTRQHHNLHIVIPDGYDIYDFTPLQHPANDPDSDIVITQFPSLYFRKIELKIQRRMLYDHKNK